MPADFRFSVKLPKAITHERRLLGCDDLLKRFSGEIAGLGDRLAIVLVQLPPSLPFERKVAEACLSALRQGTLAAVVLEPRHRSWFTAAVDASLFDLSIARVAADPAPVPAAAEPGGWPGLVYVRLHGSPRMYYSAYDKAALETLRLRLRGHLECGAPTWCIFDNTAEGAAIGNALSLVDATV